MIRRSCYLGYILTLLSRIVRCIAPMEPVFEEEARGSVFVTPMVSSGAR